MNQTNWKTKKLGEVCNIGAGNYAPQKKEFFVNGVYPFFRTSDIGQIHIGTVSKSFDYLNDDGVKGLKLYCKGTIVLPKSGASTFLNHRVMLGTDGYVSSHLATIKTDEKVLSNNYLFYFLQEIKAQDLIQDHKYPSLNLPVIGRIEIPLPPLSEQHRIVKILDEVFEQIEKVKQNTQKNLQNSKDLFESYLQNVFENKGEGWAEKRLGDCFRLKSGEMLTSKKMNKEGAFLVFGGNGIAGKHDKFNISGDNIIIGRVGALCGNVRNIKERIWLTDNAFRVIDFKYDFDNSFLTYLLNFKRLRNYARQAAQPVISNSSLEEILLQFPKPLSEQKSIVTKLDALSEKTKRLEAIYKQKLADLEELKKSVLKKAFSGEL